MKTNLKLLLSLVFTMFMALNLDAEIATFSNQIGTTSVNNDSANHELSGSIVIERNGDNIIIYYTGDEVVTFSITVNGYNIIDEYGTTWDSDNNCYIANLKYIWVLAEGLYGGYLNFIVTVSADGFNDLSSEKGFEYYLPGPSPTISYELTYNELVITVISEYSNVILLVNDQLITLDPPRKYCVPRLDQNYQITVQAGHKTAMMHDFTWSEEMTLLVPAFLYGDVNGDEYLSISDVTDLIDYLLNGYIYFQYEDWFLRKADADKNGSINIKDVTTIIDLILGQ